MAKPVQKRKTAVATKGVRSKFSNHEIVVIAAYLVGGEYRYVDTEDIAVKASELAPGRFSWRKYKDQINIETVRKRLWDATKEKRGNYLLGSEKDGWLVTQRGCRFSESSMKRLTNIDISKQRMSRNEETWMSRERVRMMSEAAFKKFDAGHLSDITPTEADRFFRVDDYVVGDARKGKIERAKNAFSKDPGMSSVFRRSLDWCETDRDERDKA